MERTLRSLTLATIVTWAAYLLWVSVAVVQLSGWMSASAVVPGLFIPIAMLGASTWIGYWSASKLPVQVAVLFQAAVLSFGCLFLASLLVGRGTI